MAARNADRYEEEPMELYSTGEGGERYDDNVTGVPTNAYREALTDVADYLQDMQAAGYDVAPTAPAPQPAAPNPAYDDTGAVMPSYQNPLDEGTARELALEAYGELVEDVAAFYAQFDAVEDYDERLAQYGLDPGEDWVQVLGADLDILEELDDVEERDVELGDAAYQDILEDGDVEVYASYGIDEEADGYAKIAVVEHEMAPSLGGFTRIGEGVAHVNEALYDFEKGKLDENGDPLDSKTVAAHEIGHNRFPWMTEFELRYKMGTPDRLTSWDANNVQKIGTGKDPNYRLNGPVLEPIEPVQYRDSTYAAS